MGEPRVVHTCTIFSGHFPAAAVQGETVSPALTETRSSSPNLPPVHSGIFANPLAFDPTDHLPAFRAAGSQRTSTTGTEPPKRLAPHHYFSDTPPGGHHGFDSEFRAGQPNPAFV